MKTFRDLSQSVRDAISSYLFKNKDAANNLGKMEIEISKLRTQLNDAIKAKAAGGSTWTLFGALAEGARRVSGGANYDRAPELEYLFSLIETFEQLDQQYKNFMKKSFSVQQEDYMRETHRALITAIQIQVRNVDAKLAEFKQLSTENNTPLRDLGLICDHLKETAESLTSNLNTRLDSQETIIAAQKQADEAQKQAIAARQEVAKAEEKAQTLAAQFAQLAAENDTSKGSAEEIQAQLAQARADAETARQVAIEAATIVAQQEARVAEADARAAREASARTAAEARAREEAAARTAADERAREEAAARTVADTRAAQAIAHAKEEAERARLVADAAQREAAGLQRRVTDAQRIADEERARAARAAKLAAEADARATTAAARTTEVGTHASAELARLRADAEAARRAESEANARAAQADERARAQETLASEATARAEAESERANAEAARARSEAARATRAACLAKETEMKMQRAQAEAASMQEQLREAKSALDRTRFENESRTQEILERIRANEAALADAIQEMDAAKRQSIASTTAAEEASRIAAEISTREEALRSEMAALERQNEANEASQLAMAARIEQLTIRNVQARRAQELADATLRGAERDKGSLYEELARVRAERDARERDADSETSLDDRIELINADIFRLDPSATVEQNLFDHFKHRCAIPQLEEAGIPIERIDELRSKQPGPAMSAMNYDNPLDRVPTSRLHKAIKAKNNVTLFTYYLASGMAVDTKNPEDKDNKTPLATLLHMLNRNARDQAAYQMLKILLATNQVKMVKVVNKKDDAEFSEISEKNGIVKEWTEKTDGNPITKLLNDYKDRQELRNKLTHLKHLQDYLVSVKLYERIVKHILDLEICGINENTFTVLPNTCYVQFRDALNTFMNDPQENGVNISRIHGNREDYIQQISTNYASISDLVIAAAEQRELPPKDKAFLYGVPVSRGLPRGLIKELHDIAVKIVSSYFTLCDMKLEGELNPALIRRLQENMAKVMATREVDATVELDFEERKKTSFENDSKKEGVVQLDAARNEQLKAAMAARIAGGAAPRRR